MAEIIQRLFSYVPANAMRLSGEEFTRSIGVQSAWSRIRIGLLVSVLPNGTSNITSNFNFGICNGQPNGGGSAVAQSALGVCMSGSMLTTGWSMSYNAGSGNPYITTGGAGKLFRRNLYQTVEAAASIASQMIALSGVGSQKRRTPIYLDITRNQGGGGLMTVAVYSTSTSVNAIDFRPDHFLDGLDQVGAPTINSQALTTMLNTTIGASDTLGGLDTVFAMWQNSAFPLEVWAIGASIERDLDYAATVAGGAFDYFDNYSPGTANASVITGGSGFTTGASFFGTVFTQSNFGSTTGYAGTSALWPYDPFETYGVGTVVSNVTLANGSGWTSNGLIN